MVGAMRRHNLLQMSISRSLDRQLDNRHCEVYPSDMRVKIIALGIYTYPDVTVVCGEPIFEDDTEDNLLNPVVIVEVLSSSTAGYDRDLQFRRYQLIPSFAEYLLVAQDAIRVEHAIRQPVDRWLWSTYGQSTDTIALPSIGCTLALAEVYMKVRFGRPA